MMTDRAGGDGVLQCPFCKCADVRTMFDRHIFAGQTFPDEPGDEGWKLRCEKCGCQTCWHHTEDQAREAWNTRASPPSGNAGEGAPSAVMLANIIDPVAFERLPDASKVHRQAEALKKAQRIRSLYAAPPQPAPDALAAPPQPAPDALAAPPQPAPDALREAIARALFDHWKAINRTYDWVEYKEWYQDHWGGFADAILPFLPNVESTDQ